VLRIGLDPVISVGDVLITRSQITTATASIILLALFYLWLRRSDLGLQFRALADNPTELALRGYNVGRLRVLAFAISGFFGSAAALMVAFDLGFDPHGGMHALLA